jgi:hypothetical protein
MTIDVPTIIVSIQKLNRNRQQHRSNKRQRRRAHQTALTCLEHARPRPKVIFYSQRACPKGFLSQYILSSTVQNKSAMQTA